MREFINIVESAGLNYYANASEEELRRIAEVEGEARSGNIQPEDASWSFVPQFPVAELISSMPGGVQGWRDWMQEELRVNDEDGLDREWAEELGPNVEPIIVAREGGKWDIWDGWHRSAAAIISGADTIPAIVGKPRTVVEGVASVPSSWQTVENSKFPSTIEDYQLRHIVADIHRNYADVVHGNLINRIDKYSKYVLYRIPLNSQNSKKRLHLNPEEWMHDDELSDRHATLPSETAPPIIYDLSAQTIVDGIHRLNAAIKRGEDSILAYVGLPENRWKNWRRQKDF